jgi:hypothetical protein
MLTGTIGNVIPSHTGMGGFASLLMMHEGIKYFLGVCVRSHVTLRPIEIVGNMEASPLHNGFDNHPVSGDRTVEVDVSGFNTSDVDFGMVFMSVIAVLIFTGTKNSP